eukprot:1582222-Prymnesium_polylepis.1
MACVACRCTALPVACEPSWSTPRSTSASSGGWLDDGGWLGGPTSWHVPSEPPPQSCRVRPGGQECEAHDEHPAVTSPFVRQEVAVPYESESHAGQLVSHEVAGEVPSSHE